MATGSKSPGWFSRWRSDATSVPSTKTCSRPSTAPPTQTRQPPPCGSSNVVVTVPERDASAAPGKRLRALQPSGSPRRGQARDHGLRRAGGHQREPAVAGGEAPQRRAVRHGGRVQAAAKGQVRDRCGAGPPPDVVPAPAPGEPVVRRRAAGDRGAAQHQQPVALQRRRESWSRSTDLKRPIGRPSRSRTGGGSAPRRRCRAPCREGSSGCAYSSTRVRQRGALAGEPVVDPRQLLQAVARRERDLAIGERVRAQHAGSDQRDHAQPAKRRPASVAWRPPPVARRTAKRRDGRERLRVHPRARLDSRSPRNR